MVRSSVVLITTLLFAAPAFSQSLGTFRWQIQPYCNVLTLTVTQRGATYQLEGFDDQCGAGTKAPVTGSAVPNADGTIQFGLTIVTTPGGKPVHLAVPLSVASLGGPWKDSDGNAGTFAFNQSTGGNPRPPSTGASAIPTVFGLQGDGGFLAGGTFDAGTIPATGAGTRMMWYPKRAAFRAGVASGDSWNEPNVGRYSIATGQHAVASGDASAAFGFETVAAGTKSLAVGHQAAARGSQSVAMGTFSTAHGNESLALGFDSSSLGQASLAGGYRAVASGARSLAFGYRASADGLESIALGGDSVRNVPVAAVGDHAIAIGAGLEARGAGSVALGSGAITTSGATGSFVFGDRTSNAILSEAPNQFVVRASGGTTFYSTATLSAGVVLPPGAGAWSALSDVNRKDNFRDLDGEEVLTKLVQMPIREWNYRSQDAATRHVGPTAQDFHAAFGLGEDPLRISTIDADGIALRAIQALEARMRADNEALRGENGSLREAMAALQARLDALERTPR